MLVPVLALALTAAPRILVLPITAGAEVTPQSAAALTEALVGELRRQQQGEIITQRDVESLLSTERTRTFLGCSTDSCLAELGGALGARQLVTGDAARLGESLLVHLRVLDTAKVRVLIQTDRRFKRGSFDDVLDALPAMVKELLRAAAPSIAQSPSPAAPPPPSTSPPSSASTPKAPPPVSRGPAVPPGAAWRALPPMPTRRSGMALVAAGGKLYAIGGWAADRPVAAVEEYDPRAGTWRARAPMPTPRSEPGTAVLDGRIYAIGGWDGTICKEVEEYDPAADRWQKRSPFPQPRSSMGAVVAAGRLFVLGGNTSGGAYLMEVHAYDPATDRWTRRSSMPVGRAFYAVAAVGDEIYALGGDAPNGARVDVYDAAADRWVTRFRPRTRLPRPGWWMAAAAANDRVFVVGGHDGRFNPSTAAGRTSAFAYDPAVDRWTELPELPWPRYLLGAAVLGNELFVAGGTPGAAAKPGEYESAAAAVLPLAP